MGTRRDLARCQRSPGTRAARESLGFFPRHRHDVGGLTPQPCARQSGTGVGCSMVGDVGPVPTPLCASAHAVGPKNHGGRKVRTGCALQPPQPRSDGGSGIRECSSLHFPSPGTAQCPGSHLPRSGGDRPTILHPFSTSRVPRRCRNDRLQHSRRRCDRPPRHSWRSGAPQA